MPAPLALLLVCVAIFGVAWALIVPPFQVPDETAHFAYVQSLAARHALPGDPRRPAGISSDQGLADTAVGASNLAFNVLTVRPDWSRADFLAYLAGAAHHPSQSDGGGPNPASVNPPLFYAYSTLAYWASGADNAFARLYAMRLWSVPLLLITVLGAWLLAGEVLGPSRLAQLLCAAVSGLVPMETFMSSSVNPDAMLVATWTLAFWLGARVIRRGLRAGDAVALCAVTAAAILTKATSYALIPATLLALLIGWRSQPAGQRRAAGLRALAGLATLAVPVLTWITITQNLGRASVNTIGAAPGQALRPVHILQFVNYLWQFYLPRLPGTTKINIVNGLPVYWVWLREGWGTFGWLDVVLPTWIYHLLAFLNAVAAVAAVAILARFRDAGRLKLLAFFVAAMLVLVLGLHFTAYRSLLASQGQFLQGRYLLPLISLLGLTVALIATRLAPRWRAIMAGALLGALLLLQIISLAAVAKTYYS